MKKINFEPIKDWWKKVESFFEKNKKITKLVGTVCFGITLFVAILLTIVGVIKVNQPIGEYTFEKTITMNRLTTPDEEEYSEEENTICPVEFESADGEYTATITFTYSEWAELGDKSEIVAYLYTEQDGEHYVIFAKEATDAEIKTAVKDIYADEAMGVFMVALAIALVAIGIGVMLFFGKYFTLYEKCWFLFILILAAAISIIMPEEGANGISGIWIMALYLADTFLNILCELLISKQSKWNFIVSVFVEIVEILCCVVLAYRFATMATTLFFWLPCDIASFINWNKKKDVDDEELTKVRTLKGWQEILLIAGIVVWTVVIGYFLSGLDIATDLFGGNDTLATVVCYLDACASAVGIVNGLAILFRFREQWIAWYICATLEAIINIMAGQWVLIPLKLGYITNTTYGYIKWTKYIKQHPEIVEERTFF